MQSGGLRVWSIVLWAVGLVLLLTPATPSAYAQLSDVRLEVRRDFVGLGGMIRPGTWMPMQLRVRYSGSEPRDVFCRWLLSDDDGDTVIARRRVTLNPGRLQPVWLYAAPQINTNPATAWTVQVVDAENERLLATTDFQAGDNGLLDDRAGAIGIVGGGTLGLNQFANTSTRHESTALVSGLQLATLPDRWYGLSVLETLIWTPLNGGAPDDSEVSEETKTAIRDWVRRGGHMVIVMPSAGEPWRASSMADMLPVDAGDMRRVSGYPPDSVGAPQTGERAEVQMTVFNVDDEDVAEVLGETREGEPVVVAKRYGMGRVTLVGIPLASQTIRSMGMPNGRYNIWHDVFNWQSPVFASDYVSSEIQAGNMSPSDTRSTTPLGTFIPGLIAMRNTAAPALLGAILVFAVYWLLAGPASYLVLRQQGWIRHSWVAFFGVVVLFTAIAWGSAALLRPNQASVSHFSVVTADAQTREAHTQSWLSLYLPEFERVRLAIEPDRELAHHTLASPGLDNRVADSGFLNSQSYAINAADPSGYEVPFRATAKQFQADYLGQIGAPQLGLSTEWVLPNGELRVDPQTAWPTGRISHQLPGPLRGVVFIYCPGDGQTPWVWRHGEPWAPGQILDVQRQSANRLVRRPGSDGRYPAQRQWNNEGFLGQLIGLRTGQRFSDAEPSQVTAAQNEIMQSIEMLSFFDALPPPNYRNTDFGFGSRVTSYRRTMGRGLDMTPLIDGRRLIIIGHLTDSPLPMPMTVGGDTPSDEGWTVIRTIHNLP